MRMYVLAVLLALDHTRSFIKRVKDIESSDDQGLYRITISSQHV